MTSFIWYACKNSICICTTCYVIIICICHKLLIIYTRVLVLVHCPTLWVTPARLSEMLALVFVDLPFVTFVRSNICQAGWLWWSGYCWDDRLRLWGTTQDQSQMLLRIQSLLFCDQEVGEELNMKMKKLLLWMQLNKDEVSKSCVSIFQDQSEMRIQSLLFCDQELKMKMKKLLLWMQLNN